MTNEKVIIKFEDIKKITSKKTVGSLVSVNNIIIPALLYNNVYFEDNDKNLVKFSESKAYIFKDFFGNIFVIRSSFDPNEDGSIPSKNQIKRSFHIDRYLYEEDDYEERYYKIYINNKVPKYVLRNNIINKYKED